MKDPELLRLFIQYFRIRLLSSQNQGEIANGGHDLYGQQDLEDQEDALMESIEDKIAEIFPHKDKTPNWFWFEKDWEDIENQLLTKKID